MPSPRKKSPSSKAAPKPRAIAVASRRSRYLSRPTKVNAATVRWMEAHGLTVRHGIERHTLLMPWLIAESVVTECGGWLGVALPDDCALWLEERAERCFACHRQFHRLIRPGTIRARGTLFMFMRHWLAALLKRRKPHLYRRLPQSYSLGVRLAPHSRAA